MMRRQATHTIEFLFRYYFYLALSYVVYYVVMFKCLEGKSYKESLHFLLFLIVSGFLVFIVQGLFVKDISSWRIAGAISVPMVVYTSYIYQEILTGKMIMFGVIALLLTAALFIAYLLYKREELNVEMMLKAFFKIASIMLAVSSSLLLIYVAGNTRTSGYVVRPTVEAKVSELDNFAIYRNEMANLSEDTWSSLSYQEKIDALQVIANCEASHLGIDHELNVAGSILPDMTYAFYREKNRSIEINLNYIEGKNDLPILSAREAIICILHESYHAYQYQAVEIYELQQDSKKSLYLFSDVVAWEKELNDYSSDYDDFDHYFSQSVESTARDYAEKRIADYELYIAMLQ